MGAERTDVSSAGGIVRIRGRALTAEDSPASLATSAVGTVHGQKPLTLARSGPHDLTGLHPDIDGATPPPGKGKGNKARRKARAAWISFVGRIIAQIVGAAATITFGLYVVNRTGQTANLKKALTAARGDTPASVPAPRPVGSRSVAVLPLQNFSPDRDQEYFADSLTEALIADLTQVSGLHVISRTSSMAFKGQRRSLPAIAQELGVRFVVEGSIARHGDRVRVTAQLIDAARDEHVWAQSYERTVRHVLAVQTEVSAAIAHGVRRALLSMKDGDARLPDQ
jgi:TolB-like protein